MQASSESIAVVRSLDMGCHHARLDWLTHQYASSVSCSLDTFCVIFAFGYVPCHGIFLDLNFILF